MKTISLKIPDEVFRKIEEYRKRTNKNRSSYVIEAVSEFNRKLEKEELKAKLERESKIAKKEFSKFQKEMEDWDSTLADGLENLKDEWS